ncbi:hypothetical protein P7K49_010787 [Saguinus oedipus]|uniref:Uncharacterized protein n=1 Tax=Saguinus oedipus TaxID=9490 RepID=A0ABQ9VNT7_SAGOE|nr:hypothetical protein P7K49_010787 [Saguinus oedipus]
MEATGVLPFVRGVDLSGNDFKVSRDGRGTGLPASLLFRPASLALASCPARLRALRVPGTAAGAGWVSSLVTNGPPRTLPGACTGTPRLDRPRTDAWARSLAGDLAGSPNPTSVFSA